MPQFSQITYQRPDIATFKKQFNELLTTFKTTTDVEVASTTINQINELTNDVISYMMLAYYRHSIDTRDAFYNDEQDFWDLNSPYIDELQTEFAKAILNSPLKEQLVANNAVFKTVILRAQNQVKTFSTKVIPLFQKEATLQSAYDKLIASAQIEFQGQTLNLPQLDKHTTDLNEATRKAAQEAVTAFFVAHEDEFDDLYDQLVTLRTQIAHELGFSNYAEMSLATMNRFDYDQTMINDYREAVATYVTPAVSRLYQRQAQRFHKDHLNYYDLPLEFPDGNATPIGTPAELVQKAQTMYHEMSPQTGAFFDEMIANDAMDLISKPGKQSGGYCEFVPKWQQPIIFANFNGTSGDIDVLTHEAGHAFQTYEAKWIKFPDYQFPTFEAAEIFSMSMEFFAYPWIDLFVGKSQTLKYTYSHLANTLFFLPYGVLVDHFQYEVYTHPEMTPANRKATWRRLEQKYLPFKDYSTSPDLDRGIYWYRQGHIFTSPFYYIDYTIAQVVAQQFWQRTIAHPDEHSFPDYLKMAKAGGSKTFSELIAIGHLKSPFAKDTLKEIVFDIEQSLDAISEASLTSNQAE